MADYNLKTPERPVGLLQAVEKLMYWAQVSLPAVYGEELTYAKEQGKMAAKINEVVEQLNVNTEWTEYLLNEGVENETITYINELINNGTLASLINNELLTDINEQIAQNQRSITGLTSSKVDKGGNEQVTWANLTQEVKSNITGGNTPVVGENSVNTSNIVNKAVTGQKVIENLNDILLCDQIGYNDVDDTVIIKYPVVLLFNDQYRLINSPTSETTITYPLIKYGSESTGNNIFYFDVLTSDFKYVTAMYWANMQMSDRQRLVKLFMTNGFSKKITWQNQINMSYAGSATPIKVKSYISPQQAYFYNVKIEMDTVSKVFIISSGSAIIDTIVDWVNPSISAQTVSYEGVPYGYLLYDPSLNSFKVLPALNTQPRSHCYVLVQIENGIPISNSVANFWVNGTKYWTLPSNKPTPSYNTDMANVKWLALGDSITNVNQSSPNNYYVRIVNTYGLNGTNLAYAGAGWKHQWGINAINDQINMITSKPDIMTIMAGINDVSNYANALGEVTDTTSDTICGCINIALNNLYGKYPDIRLGIMSPEPNGSWSNDSANLLTNFIAKLEEICLIRSIPYLNMLHCNLRPWANQIGNNKTECYYNGDGTHPNDAGNALIYKKVYEFLRTL